jgi:uncharacterized glyoxalase superfamily protein PhnB
VLDALSGIAVDRDAIGVVVSDLRRSIDFYRRLGLEFESADDAHGHVEATGAGVRFMLDTEETVRSFDPDWRRPDGNSIGLAFLCDSPADVDRLHADLIAAGAQSHKEPWDAFWGQRYAQVRDPDGHVVDLFATL